MVQWILSYLSISVSYRKRKESTSFFFHPHVLLLRAHRKSSVTLDMMTKDCLHWLCLLFNFMKWRMIHSIKLNIDCIIIAFSVCVGLGLSFSFSAKFFNIVSIQLNIMQWNNAKWKKYTKMPSKRPSIIQLKLLLEESLNKRRADIPKFEFVSYAKLWLKTSR